MTIRALALHAAASTLLALSGAVHAQLFRAYVASDGSDVNPCTLAQPCRLLPAALAAVASGGEIWMLDSANYNTGPVAIGKSVSILAIAGAVGSLVALNGGPAVTIPTSGLKVALRNIAIGPMAGAAPGTSGVVMTGASQLEIEDCVIANLPSVGVYVVGTGMLKMSDCTLRNIGTYGVWVQDGARAVVASTRIHDSQGGLLVMTLSGSVLTEATLSGGVISGCDGGVKTYADALSSISRASVKRTTIDNVSYPIDSETGTDGTAEIDVGGSAIVSGYYPWHLSGPGAKVFSLGDNQISGNVAPPVGATTPLAPQ